MIINTVVTEVPSLDPPQVLQELSVPGGTDRIVLVNPDLAPLDRPFQNLLRVDNQRRPVWQASLPPGNASDWHDSYVEIRWEDSYLAANTWSGWFVLIDPDTGDIRKAEFAK
jgi:hypothetical protein